MLRRDRKAQRSCLNGHETDGLCTHLIAGTPRPLPLAILQKPVDIRAGASLRSLKNYQYSTESQKLHQILRQIARKSGLFGASPFTMNLVCAQLISIRRLKFLQCTTGVWKCLLGTFPQTPAPVLDKFLDLWVHDFYPALSCSLPPS